MCEWPADAPESICRFLLPKRRWHVTISRALMMYASSETRVQISVLVRETRHSILSNVSPKSSGQGINEEAAIYSVTKGRSLEGTEQLVKFKQAEDFRGNMLSNGGESLVSESGAPVPKASMARTVVATCSILRPVRSLQARG